MNFQNHKVLQRRLDCLDPESAAIQQKKLQLIQNYLYERNLNNEVKFFVRDLKTLANENRLKILLTLGSQERCICELEFLTGLSQPTISHHVGRLENNGYVTTRKEGKWVNVGLTKKGNKALEGQIENKLFEFLKELNYLNTK
ncbi:MAG: ArsR/SmtB family transcription factor [Promethearchaeota archaeon]